MRKIKFRAWDGEKMLNHRYLSEFMLRKSQGNGCYYAHINQSVDDELELMQFTGLCDKNGVEIYEGDVLKSFDEVYKVEWQRIGWNPFVDSMIDGYKSYRFEVIGNIYENPELLERTNG